nr:immunoglobulin light chain junction region [Macaca mulatta]MPN91956.1 immunoglobulin light chain junction region [Macaca mulatta]MPN96622.1 immunoglobulin light chain junction region [Macaca mulatta]MPN97744.1 immunoglobulin light chain junction region [Macaca mulatta]MPN98757.1 immunoglobulin light chain junction region [Macaca mulatta]
CQHYYSTPHSF